MSECRSAVDTNGLCSLLNQAVPSVMSEMTHTPSPPRPPPHREPSWMGGSPLAQLWPFPPWHPTGSTCGDSGSQPLFIQRGYEGGRERKDLRKAFAFISKSDLTGLKVGVGGNIKEY